MCYQCIRHSSIIWMCLSYRRWCAIIRVAMQWIHIFPLVSGRPDTVTWTFDSFHAFTMFISRLSWDFSLSYFTWCVTGHWIFASKRFYPSQHTGQSHSYQSNKGRTMRFPWNIRTDIAWSTHPSSVRFTAAQYKRSKLVGARSAGAKFVRLQWEIGHL